jgi:hypothetical protein
LIFIELPSKRCGELPQKPIQNDDARPSRYATYQIINADVNLLLIMVKKRNFCDRGFTEIQDIHGLSHFIGGVLAVQRHSAAEDKTGGS